MSPSKRHIQLEELILKKIDGVISDAEFSELCGILREDTELLKYYLEFISLCGGMLKPGEAAIPGDCFSTVEDIGQSALWQALAENERTAETVYLEKPIPLPPVDSVRRDRVVGRQKVSRIALYTAIISTAALLLMIAYVVILPRKGQDAVATLTGGSHAVWSQADGPAGENKRLYTNSTLFLVEGFAEITFDNQARVILQSPVEINIEDYNQIFLRSGKLSAVVPKTARGFVVRTTGASIVDYGTEFGVTANAFGRTEAHVFLGKVELRSGSNPARFNAAKSLFQGQASHVDEAGVLSAETMEAQPSSYVRRLPARETFGQPGKRLDLADIVGRGNGFGTGRECVGIDPASGQLVAELSMLPRIQKNNWYSPVPEMPCIDGVFVPLGGENPQVVTSKGHLFKECPQTDGRYWIEITNKPITGFEGNLGSVQLARLNGIQYGTDMHPAIMMHSNTGITFDLDAIRSTTPGTRICRFTSSCGLSETLLNTPLQQDAGAYLWVLVDGQKREMVHVTPAEKNHAFVTVNISENDRFLTLISCSEWNAGDWTFFGDPCAGAGTNRSGVER